MGSTGKDCGSFSEGVRLDTAVDRCRYEPPKPLGMGAVLYSPLLPTMIGCYMAMPLPLLEQLVPKKQQISQGEATACVLGLASTPELFQDVDLIHFVDNTAALAAIITGSSGKRDVAPLACAYQLLLAQRGSRLWAEYVESDANIADGPSRDGDSWFASEEASALNVRQVEARLPAFEVLASSSFELLFGIFANFLPSRRKHT